LAIRRPIAWVRLTGTWRASFQFSDHDDVPADDRWQREIVDSEPRTLRSAPHSEFLGADWPAELDGTGPLRGGTRTVTMMKYVP
jgi:hypothetical protein